MYDDLIVAFWNNCSAAAETRGETLISQQTNPFRFDDKFSTCHYLVRQGAMQGFTL
jgi:hypothetical protein